MITLQLEHCFGYFIIIEHTISTSPFDKIITDHFRTLHSLLLMKMIQMPVMFYQPQMTSNASSPIQQAKKHSKRFDMCAYAQPVPFLPQSSSSDDTSVPVCGIDSSYFLLFDSLSLLSICNCMQLISPCRSSIAPVNIVIEA